MLENLIKNGMPYKKDLLKAKANLSPGYSFHVN